MRKKRTPNYELISYVSAAVLIFFAAAAGTRIIGLCFLFLSDGLFLIRAVGST